MRGEEGVLKAYLYHQNIAGEYGANIITQHSDENYKLPIGKWITIKQYVKINSKNDSKGFLKVWTQEQGQNEKLVLNENNLIWMTENSAVDKFLISTFLEETIHLGHHLENVIQDLMIIGLLQNKPTYIFFNYSPINFTK